MRSARIRVWASRQLRRSSNSAFQTPTQKLFFRNQWPEEIRQFTWISFFRPVKLRFQEQPNSTPKGVQNQKDIHNLSHNKDSNRLPQNSMKSPTHNSVKINIVPSNTLK